jgi:hypothetical protein
MIIVIERPAALGLEPPGIAEPPIFVEGWVKKLPSGLCTRMVVCVPGRRLVFSQLIIFPAVAVGMGVIEV